MSPMGFWRVVDVNKDLFLCSSKILLGATVKTLDTIQTSPKSWNMNVIFPVGIFVSLIIVAAVIFLMKRGKEQAGVRLGRAVHGVCLEKFWERSPCGFPQAHLSTKMSPLRVIGSSQLGWE